jgi:hypothetical protein
MIEIYFDGKLLDNSNYLAFDVNFKPFDKEFYLGSTGSINASLTIPKGALPDSLNKVQIKMNNENWYTCVVDSIEENDNEEYKINLMDVLVHTEVGYDFSLKVPISAKELLESICTDFEIPHDEFNFTNKDVVIESYDSTVTAREYIGMIAELAGGYATINSDGKLEIRTYLDDISNNTIDSEEVDSFKIKNTITIERVVWEFVSDKRESSEDQSLYTLYLDGNNLFLQNMTSEIFNNICNNIIGLNISNIKITTTNKFFKDKGIIKFIDRENKEHKILPFYEASYNGGLVGSYESNLDNSKENETKVKTTAQNTRRIKQTIDQNNNTLQVLVEDVKIQKEVTNNELQQSIESNTTLIEQTSSAIRQEVSEKEGTLQTNIKGVQDNLDETNETLKGMIEENKGSIEILSKSISSTVKSIGGNNLIRNSVGYATSLNEDNVKTLDFWTITNPSNIETTQDADTESSSISGSKITFKGTCKMEQEFVTSLKMSYGVSLKLRHHINGGTPNHIKIYIKEGEDILNVINTDQETTEYINFTQLSEFNYEASITNPKIVIEVEGDDLIEITDLMVSQGDNQAWGCYVDEVYGKEHRLDKYGLKLIDLTSGDYSEQTVKGLKFVDDGETVAEVSKNQVKSEKAIFNHEMSIRTLKWIALDDENIIEYIE